ncbi:HNH endonuclease family protein [Corynebacterium marinum]|uniref:GmrSD restriction endonucleases C-terminal domain-containing protein n=1 Tax=Corynebacterium marinum DSM 44953 TaxID=1224162 RepID=A0A0B6TSK6_9CORY|nr:HNH endonuclease family protein [Corynebacterium marinum]AJK68575.1 hypothetical protein B840_04780 [Corynebacterium marinum DSM 44953]GGO14608.1 hypothetical protein GCM10010980_09110 [Corynebacterium marinum]
MRPFRIYLLLLICATIALALPGALSPHRDDPGLPALDALLPRIKQVPQRHRVLGYDRAAFGPGWSPQADCTVREAALARAGGRLENCRVTAGTVSDPYTGEVLDLRGEVEIDHVLPLSAAWDLGAHGWTPGRRSAFANDPVNLVATSRAANREKSDLLPAAWQPTDRGSRCWYARRLALVAVTHELPLPAGDVRAMRQACRMNDFTGDWLGWSVDH